jgi:CheY-like chemotaxis protein
VGYKILLADDSVTVQKIITLTFSDEGVDVVTVNNGDEAFHRLQYMRPALVMADVSIPGRNGYEICEFVKKHPDMRNTPVILLVPAFEPFDEDRARRIGADYHLTKPFQSIRTLISTVKNLIEPESARASLPPAPEAVSAPEPQVVVEVDSKSIKIDELIRQAAATSSDRTDEDEPLSEIDLDQSGFVQAAALSVAQIQDDSLVYQISGAAPQAAGIENHFAQISSESLLPNTGLASNDFDDVLELDDVLPELHPASIPVSEIVPIEPAAPVESSAPAALSRSVVDEIVNRVVAQLSETLPGLMAEKLAGEIARCVAPEVAEIIKRQQLPTPAAQPATENLLEID